MLFWNLKIISILQKPYLLQLFQFSSSTIPQRYLHLTLPSSSQFQPIAILLQPQLVSSGVYRFQVLGMEDHPWQPLTIEKPADSQTLDVCHRARVVFLSRSAAAGWVEAEPSANEESDRRVTRGEFPLPILCGNYFVTSGEIFWVFCELLGAERGRSLIGRASE